MPQPQVPSWDTNFPAQAQQRNVAAANNDVVTPPPPHAQAPIDENTPINTASTPAPNTANTPAPQGPAPTEEPPKFEDTLPMPEEPPKFEDTSPMPGENVPQFDDTPADNTVMAKYVKDNLQVLNAQAVQKPGQPKTKEATSFLESLEAGLEMSTAGLAIRGKMPDVVLPEHSDRAYRIANQIGTLAGDMPAMLAGGFFGGLAGGAAGTAEFPVVGTVAGAAVGAGAGSFALPAALRKIMVDHYEKGDIKTSGEFVDRLMSTTWEATKGGVVGAATAITGGAAKYVAGPLAAFATELGTMTTLSSAMEGHLPSSQDFIDGAFVMGGLHGVGMVKSKLMNIHAATGELPQTILQATTDPQLKQEMLSHDLETPKGAEPTELKHVEVPTKEGEEPIIERNKLVPKDLSVKPPEIVEPSEGRSAEENEIISKIGRTAKPVEPTFSEKFDSFYAKTVDFTDPLKSAYAAFKEKTGTELPAEQNPHVQARLFAGHIDLVRRVLDQGVPDANGNFDPNGRGLNKIYRDVPNDDQLGFDAYSLAKRGIEVADKGMTPWEGFNREGAEKVIASGKEKFDDLHRERVEAQNKVIDYGVAKGVIDPGIAEASKTENKEYIPLNRIIPEDELTGQAEMGNGKLINKLEGSELELKNPRDQIYKNIQAILKRAEINDIRKMTVDNLSYRDEDGFLKNDFVREVPLEGQLGKNQIAIFRDGEMKALEGTPLVIDSLKRLEGDKTAMNLTTKMAAAFSKSVRIGQVADPGFAFRHFFRSSMMSGVYSQTGQIPFVHPAMALGEFMGAKSETYKNWLSDGGATGSFEKMEKDYVSNGLEEADAKYPFLNNAWNVIKKPLDAAEVFIKMTDNLSRFTEYKRALNQGTSRDQAAFLAREVTPDFAKVGIERSALRTAVAFQGAHINSLDRMRQAFVEDAQGTILRMSALSGISAMLWYANKDDKDVADLPEYKKDLYWNFNVSRMFDSSYGAKPEGDSGTIFSLPKPWGPGILFGSGTERTLDAFFKDEPEAYKNFGKSLMDSVVPNIIPSMAAPVLDQMANKNLFTGRQLVTNEQQKLLPEMQYQPYTSETAKQIAKLIQYVPGVRDIGPSSDPLCSPAVVENYIRGWTGIMGGWVLKILDKGINTAKGTPSDVGPNSVETPLAEYPILSEFMTRFPSMKSQPVQTFYDNYDKTSKVMNSISTATKRGDIDTASRIMTEHPDLEFKLNTISKAISTGRQVINKIQDTPGISPVEKRQLIDGVLFQIGSSAKMGNQMMDDFHKQIDKSKDVKEPGTISPMPTTTVPSFDQPEEGQ